MHRLGAAASFVIAAASACHAGAPSNEPPDQAASPQAKAEPAPIATPPAAGGAAAPLASANAAFVALPEPLRADEEPSPDALPHDAGIREGAKDAPAVYTLTLALRASDVAAAPKGMEVSPSGLEAARRKAEPVLVIDLTPGHARAVLASGFVLPDATELRVRADRFGAVVVPPDGATYRVAASGSLRAVLGEGLFDVAPSSAAEVNPRGEGARRLTRPTRHVDVTTRAAKGAFELAHVPELGDSGVLVCRLLLDLMSAGPTTPVCADGDVPLHVEVKWSAEPPGPSAAHGRVAGTTTFEAVSFVRRTDAAPSSFLTPPPTAKFVGSGEPVHGSHLFLTRAELAALRTANDPAAAHAEGPQSVLSLHNSTDELRYVWLDGVPLAWLAPGGRLDVGGMPHARATLQWRTFLGDAVDPGQVVNVPTLSDAANLPGAEASSAGSRPP